MSTTSTFTAQTVDRISRQAKEPGWVAELRAKALQLHGELPWPSSGDDIWRRTDVSALDPSQGFALPDDSAPLQSVRVSDRQLAQFAVPMADEQLVVRADGAWLTPSPLIGSGSSTAPSGSASSVSSSGIAIEEIARSSASQAGWLQAAIESDGLSLAEQKLSSLNTAFHRDGLLVDIPAGYTGAVPLRLVRLLTAAPQAALFPLTVIRAGRGSTVVVIEEDVGLGDIEQPHLINGRIELLLEPQSNVHYCRVQRWGPGAREFMLQRATLQDGAQLTMVNISFGAAITKDHIIAKLAGPHASSRVFGFVHGQGRQHIDFHSLQDHLAPNTTSDLLYKAALEDDSRMIYTGLIRIAKAAKQTDAYQANNNLLLSRRTKAETIPMLEILADDVRCKHGATIGPVDEEQLFYLMTRGVAREQAERLLVMAFVDPVIEQVPFEPIRQRLRQELEGSLHI